MKQQLDDPNFPTITYRRGASGWVTPVLRGTGVRVQTVAVAVEKLKIKPEEFARQYNLDISQVREAIQFYHAHRAEIDANIRYESDLEKQYKQGKAKRRG
jgi:uncharacterized protein (DUF433 family)